jgi:hypothetical protein
MFARRQSKSAAGRMGGCTWIGQVTPQGERPHLHPHYDNIEVYINGLFQRCMLVLARHEELWSRKAIVATRPAGGHGDGSCGKKKVQPE